MTTTARRSSPDAAPATAVLAATEAASAAIDAAAPPAASLPAAAVAAAAAVDPRVPPARAAGSFTIFFPAWNEEDLIVRAVSAGREVCERLRSAGEIGEYEILVVDDASTDGTGKLADELADEDPAVRVVHHRVNRKLGGALKTGFANARGDVVLYTDADLPFDMRDVEKAMRLLRIYEADIVSPYRLDRTAEGPRRTVYSFAYNHLVRWAFGLRLRDVNFAFKLLRRRVLDHVTLESEGSFIDVELLASAQRRGFEIIQFGVDYFPRTRGMSTLSSPEVIRTMLAEMARLAPEIRRRQPLPAAVLEAR
jgi:cellulose synthase/poly-beta-1,6-N-acetylglucosamine synthase-like glycosyltransferase